MKKSFFKAFIFSVLSLVLFTNCEEFFEHTYSIELINNSNVNIGYYFAAGGEFGTFYPDSLPKTEEYIMKDYSKVKSPGFIAHKEWNEFFNDLPKDTLSVFIFSTDTLNTYPWEQIRKDYNILKRYDLSIDDVKKMNYKIIYE